MQKTSGNERMDDADLRAAEELTAAYHKMTRELERVIIGQGDVLKQILIALFSLIGGAFIGFVYAFVLGYALGRTIGTVYNLFARP